ncbi:MAG: ATP-binding protein [Candidatus Ancaeobacter aquaticus]|nr:ATP-binding protein [Candidatus Ancaeobacter aquaticus]
MFLGGCINTSIDKKLRNIKILIAVRLLFITVALLLAVFLLKIQPAPFYYVIAIVYVLSFFYLFLFVKKKWTSFAVYLQLVVDVIIETALIHFTGGVDSFFAFLYIPTIVCASFMMSERGAGIITGIVILCYSFLVTGEYYHVIPTKFSPWSSYTQGGLVVLYVVSFRMVILGFAGYLSIHLNKLLSDRTKELYQVKNLSERVFEAMFGGVITVDKNDTIQYANSSAAEILQVTIESIIGKDWRDIFKISDEKMSLDEHESLFQMNVPVTVGDTELKVFKIHISYLYDENKQHTGKVILFSDVTEVLELKRKVKQSEKLVIMGELASGMAHEIRNPLASICGSIELLKEQDAFDNKNVNLANVILKESGHLNKLIEEFLYYSKGKPENERNWNLNSIVFDTINLIRMSLQLPTNIRVEIETQDDTITVFVDADQIKQVLINLINNAVDVFVDSGVVTIRTALIPKEGKVFAQIKVEDNGPGISKDVAGRIFDPFYSTKKNGYGIGLAICQSIIERHNGKIEVESLLGQGTIFTILLPVAK